MEGKFGIDETGEGIFRDEFPTREDAKAEGMARDCGEFSTGEYYKLKHSIYVDEVLERLAECAYGEVGEVAEDFLQQVPDGQRNELQDGLNGVLGTWMMKHGYSDKLFGVKDVHHHNCG